ncbi:hypothetical protein SFRURICE_021088 [Spodoptera frugiperda]|nr:hypothetical protein SFRURICE_021088 [Spodoptera frugiperda]
MTPRPETTICSSHRVATCGNQTCGRSMKERRNIMKEIIILTLNLPNSASKIIALVPKEHAPSDASEISDSETELHDAHTNSSTPLSFPAPSIAYSLASLTLYIR